MKPEHKRLVINKREDWLNGWMHNVCLQGDSVIMQDETRPRGMFCMRALDAGENGFPWRRVILDTDVPSDGLLAVYALVSDHKYLWDDEDMDAAVMSGALTCEKLTELFGAPIAYSNDFYVNRAGRYLWLMFEFKAAGRSPKLSGVEICFQGDHMLSYLPAIYRDDFTYRFLSIFDSFFMDMERKIDHLPGIFDYESAQPELLSMLAGWLGVDDCRCDTEGLRQRVRRAMYDCENLYTVDGVAYSVLQITGRKPLIIEHADVDANRVDCKNPEVLKRLYGENPFCFFVLLPHDTFANRQEQELFIEHMQERIPAHTQMELVLLKPCIQLDWHSYLGVNSYVGSYMPVKIDESTTIHYDSMIGGEGN